MKVVSQHGRRTGGCGLPDDCRHDQTKSTLLMFGVNAITGGTDDAQGKSRCVSKKMAGVSGHGGYGHHHRSGESLSERRSTSWPILRRSRRKGFRRSADLIPTCKVDSSVRSVRVYRSDGATSACAPDSIKQIVCSVRIFSTALNF